MAWQGTKTWVSGPWSFSDANAYIRDNLKSMRKWQQAVALVSDGVFTIVTSNSQIQHLRLLEVMDEDLLVSVFYNGQLTLPTGGATTATISLIDSQGVTQSTLVPVIAQQDFGACVSFISPAAITPGYTFTLKTNVGGCTVFLNSLYMLSPIV